MLVSGLLTEYVFALRSENCSQNTVDYFEYHVGRYIRFLGEQDYPLDAEDQNPKVI